MSKTSCVIYAPVDTLSGYGSRSIQGSPQTPYIFDDRCTWEDACERIKEVYSLPREERKARGLKGREWALSDEAGFTAERQGERVMEAFTELFI